MDGSFADLRLVTRFQEQLTDIETRIACAPFPLDLKASCGLVARARKSLVEVEDAVGLLEFLPVGALSYVQRRAGIAETEWPSPRQILRYLDWESFTGPKERCPHTTKRGRQCRAKVIPGGNECWSHLAKRNDGVPVELFRQLNQQLEDAVSRFGSRLASKPLENTGGPEDRESRSKWAEEMVCDFYLDPNDSTFYKAYCNLRPFAVEGTIPLWALRTMVFRWVRDADIICCHAFK